MPCLAPVQNSKKSSQAYALCVDRLVRVGGERDHHSPARVRMMKRVEMHGWLFDLSKKILIQKRFISLRSGASMQTKKVLNFPVGSSTLSLTPSGSWINIRKSMSSWMLLYLFYTTELFLTVWPALNLCNADKKKNKKNCTCNHLAVNSFAKLWIAVPPPADSVNCYSKKQFRKTPNWTNNRCVDVLSFFFFFPNLVKLNSTFLNSLILTYYVNILSFLTIMCL